MADQYDEGYSDETESNTIKAVRDLYNAEKAAKKALEAELATLRGQVRNVNVSTVLSAKGVDTGIAKFIPNDVTDAEAIEAWLTENGKYFGVQEQAPNGNVSNDTAPSAPSRLQALNAAGTAPDLTNDILAKLRNVDKTSTQAETAELLRQAAALYNQ